MQIFLCVLSVFNFASFTVKGFLTAKDAKVFAKNVKISTISTLDWN